jgi:acyl-[acyl-carrier-protein]-phospholipid O-acyltransferase/long-chain-fatty-acid--[acyl-carrier-protein] ligase
MQNEEPDFEPTKRQWLGYWSMIVQQTQNAFNDKAAQFILIPLGGAVGFAVESAAGLMIALPFVLFAPLAGWMSDRFSKRNVILGAAIAQVAILALISAAVLGKNLPLALFGFFLLAVQSAFFSPSKIGINKELVGSKHLGFAAGVQQMTAMLAILAGQIVAAWWFDARYRELGAGTENAWKAAFFPMLIILLCSVPAIGMALLIPKVLAHQAEKLSGKLLISHFKDISALWQDLGLRSASLGVAYFWGFAAFINLWSLKLAKSLTNGGEGFGTMSSLFMAAASLGMALGFAVASALLRKRIELGWVPLSAMAMTISALIVALLPAGGVVFMIALGLLAFFSAMFLSPLNAWIQDRYPADKRGELQSAVNLQDCLAGIIAVVAIELMELLFGKMGLPSLASFRVQMIVVGLSCGVMSWYVLRILPADFVRLLCNGAVKFLYRIRSAGFEQIPKTGGALLLPNHVTFADAFFISAACPRPLRFVMDETFMRSPLIRLSAKLFGTVPIRRDQPLEAVRQILEALKHGDVVVLFPEGQLTRSGGLCELERGCELIARKSGSPVFPLWVDGSWGSIFSYERGRFFRKVPYRIPYGISVALGEQIAAGPKRNQVQAALLKASAEAVNLRYEFGARRNGHQLTQLGALPRGEIFRMLEGDEAAGVGAALEEFVRQTKGEIVRAKTFEPKPGDIWIGGESLRKCIEVCGALEIRFFDFSKDALISINKSGVIHLPCLAGQGMVIAMSFPHPEVRGDFQAGHKENSWGKLLPGWYWEGGKILPGEIELPVGSVLDSESFLVQA